MGPGNSGAGNLQVLAISAHWNLGTTRNLGDDGTMVHINMKYRAAGQIRKTPVEMH